MLKHVTYRSTSSLGRSPTELTCRGSSVCHDTLSLKGDLSPSSPEMTLKGKSMIASPDTLSLKDTSLSDLKGFSPDSISLHSTLSFSSLAIGRLSSRCSSTASLNEPHTTPVKVYLRSLRPDIEYKTVSLSSSTTCRQLILMLLAKFRLRHRDPNLFYVTMEVVVRGPGGGAPARRLLVLDDHACPAELQQCRPRGEARFSVGVRRGGLLRVHDSILMPGSQYKSLLVSYRTTAEELVQLLLNCYSSKENPKNYAVHEVNKNPYSDRPLEPEEFPLLVQSEWPRASRHNCAFVLRRNVSYSLSLKSRVSWRRSLDQSSTDTESEHEDHNTTIGSLISTSSVSSALSISSSGSDSSEGSSSGVSSMASPNMSLASLKSSLPVTTPTSSATSSPVATPASSAKSSPVVSPASSPAKSASSGDAKAPAADASKPQITTTTTTITTTTQASKPPVPSPAPQGSSPAGDKPAAPKPVPRTILNIITVTGKIVSTPQQRGQPAPSASRSESSSLPKPIIISTTLAPSSSASPSPASASPAKAISSSCSSSSLATLGSNSQPEVPPLPKRRSSCCPNYENCFYI
ncbi:uncharacterized protein LOC125033600 [Penaeus chinensis]|uniref:uncharacterized protein LOC125033600 n=1 Tax=Penaeus chinensis TaxID=139456 RepID=UPI001FB6A8EC|nr:uncharacterized protein LOC125033600 [Penaeus chinensis]